VDAYSSYIMQVAEARTSELRREAAEYAMSRAARGEQSSRWTRARARFARRRRPVVAPVPLPTRAPQTELRRSA
jgi:hypothetical protein